MASSKLNAADYFPKDQTDDSVVDDLSMIPLEKDTFAICELCGRIGRRGQFYPRNTKYCSLRCNVSATRRKHCNWRFKMMEGTEHMAGMIPLEPLPQLHSWHATFNDIQTGPIKHSAANVTNSYEWKDELFGCDFLAAPVSLFKHAPLHEMWDSTFEGMKVEVKNTDCINVSEKLGDYFWVATVLKVKGYMGLLRYEGFGSDDSKDFWVNLCCSEVHPVGWCATRGKPLIPPKTIEHKYNDWKKFLVKQLTGARTLPANFYSKLTDSLKSRFNVGTVLEVVDKNRISQVKVASVHEIVGKRLHIKYYDSVPEDNGFWCHEDSPLIHPVGWAFRVGHPLDAPIPYSTRVAAGRHYPSDATPDMFYNYPNSDPPLFSKGMKIEAIDPLNLSSICAATVMEILSEGYMMIRIDFYPPEETGADWFCYHQRSPCIFPVGFALANNLALVPPIGYTPENFKWEEYLACTESEAAGRTLFTPRGHLVSHGFVAGMRLECADLMDPRLVCVATVARVVADLLKIHFDGWGDEYDQWLWAHSTDIYPVGWCKAVGHRLEGPLQPPPRPPRPTKKPRAAKPSRRKKKPLPQQNNQPPNTNEESSQYSDIADTKSLSPLTTVSEISADIDTRHSMTSENTMDTGEHGMDTGEHVMDTGKHTMVSGKHTMVSGKHTMVSGKHVMDSGKHTRVSGKHTRYSGKHLMDTGEHFMDSGKHTRVSGKHLTDTGEHLMDSGEHLMDSGEHLAVGMEIDEGKEEEDQGQVSKVHEDCQADFGAEESQQEQSKSSDDSTEHHKKEDVPTRIPTPETISQQETNKVIPRLVNNATVPLDILNSVDPITWSTDDVAKFLTINDCQPYCVNFSKIPGPMMLKLTKDEIIELLQMKVGPSLKIFDLIQQLKCKIKQPHRLLGNFK